jgi:tetraacyldisaccharide 4'-kinase
VSGPLPRALAPITVPLSWLYRFGIELRNRKYDRGRGVQTVDRPVISVGNLTTGGTGKTPMVAWMARQLIEARAEPLIAMRGYKAVNGVSDEEAEYREILPDPHVIANPKRARAIQAYLSSHPDVCAIILDDGFQHRQIKRDLDLVLIDATANTFRDRLLPAGNLREPIASLRRADAVIVTHADSEISDLKSQIERHHGKLPIASCRHVWTHLTFFDHESRPDRLDINWLKGKRVGAMLGVGNPAAILKQLQAAGATIEVNIPAADHQRYDANRLATADQRFKGCDALVTTGKDWVKLSKVIDWKQFSLPIVVPRLELKFVEGESDLVGLLLQRVRASKVGEFAR